MEDAPCIELGVHGEVMNSEAVEKIANAVLYEGYMLYPYRRVRGEEPAALQFRGAVSARLLRGAGGRRRMVDADRMPGARQCLRQPSK